MPPSRQSSLKGGARPSSGLAGAAATGGATSVTSMTTHARQGTPTSSSSMDTMMAHSGGTTTSAAAAAAAIATYGQGAANGRITPSFSNSFVNRPGSASAVNRRRSEQAVTSPNEPHATHGVLHHAHHNHHYHHPHYGQHHPYANVFEEEGPRSATAFDDESDKGHGPRRASASVTSTSGRWTPTILTNMLRRAGGGGEGRFSPVNSFQPNGVAASQHQASPQSPHHRFFSPASPRMKVISTEPEEIESGEEHAHAEKQWPIKSIAEQSMSGEKVTAPLSSTSSSRHAPPPSSEGAAQHRSASVAGYYAPAQQMGVGHTSAQGSMKVHHPLSHAHKMSSSSTMTSSHSIQMHSPQMRSHSRHTSMQQIRGGAASMTPSQPSPILAPTSSSSPLVVPQARRGAINLRKASRRRKATAARRKRASLDSTPVHIRIARFVRLLFWTLCHPLSACKGAHCYFSSTCHSIDMAFRDPRTGARDWKPKWLSAYIPLLIWLGVSLSSTFTVLIWHTQVFQALDRMSAYLQSLGLLGRLIFGALIFITTFPPLPLYSTLIILCGFSFGLVQGFIISYIAALSGAIIVFLLSRSLLKGWMVGLLNQSGGLRKVVRAIEKRPKLLFLVRLAPYPYNLMNTLLASSPTLTLKTYTLCTALALPKLVVHCGLGTTIKNFAAYNGAAASPEAPFGHHTATEAAAVAPTMIGNDLTDMSKASETAELVKHVAGFVGVGLCVGIFLYLFSIARKAVDEELDDDELAADEYELMLSDDEEEEESVDGLDEDSLNIAQGGALSGSRDGSSEGTRIGEEQSGSGSGSQRSSSQAGRDAPSSPMMGTRSSINPRAASIGAAAYGPARFNHQGSEATLVDPRPAGALLSGSVHQKKSAPIGDGSTPLFVAPSSGMGGVHGDGSGSITGGPASYFGAWTGNVQQPPKNQPRNSGGGNGYPRAYMDSHVSLADSIVEMEKHADLLNSDPDDHVATLGAANGVHPYDRHDVSIELSPPPAGRGMRAKMTAPSSVVGDVQGDAEVDERRILSKVDRNRASRRSQMGYEEENVTGTGQ